VSEGGVKDNEDLGKVERRLSLDSFDRLGSDFGSRIR
jgi:hypothetical protein